MRRLLVAACPLLIILAVQALPVHAQSAGADEHGPIRERLERIEARLNALFRDADAELPEPSVDQQLSPSDQTLLQAETQAETEETSASVQEQATGTVDKRLSRLEERVGTLTDLVSSLRGELRGLIHGDDDPATSGPGAPPQTLGQLPGSLLPETQSSGVPFDLSRELSVTADPPASDVPVPGGDGTQVRTVSAPSGLSDRDTYDEAYRFVLIGQYSDAEAAFSGFLERFPNSEFAGNARFWLGESLYQQQQFAQAARQFLAVSQSHPDGPKAAEGLLKLGLSLRALGENDAACSSLREINDRYPDAPAAIADSAREAIAAGDC